MVPEYKVKGAKMESSHTSALLFTFEIFMTEITFSLCKDTVMPLHSEKDLEHRVLQRV